METYLERIELLIGKHGIQKLQNASVMVVGIGGVGSYAAESLARCGIGTIILIDHDTVAPSNLNRQIHATFDTIDRAKTEVMKERILTYRKDIQIIEYKEFYNANKNELFFQQHVDFVIDAIDTISAKIELIQYCLLHKIPFISSMGMANRWDPSQLRVMDLMKTKDDPLAKIMRQLVRKNRIKGKIPVVCSCELPFTQTMIVNENGINRKQKMPPASTPFVPSSAGLICASQAIKKILSETGDTHEI